MPPAPHLGLACDGYALTEWGDPEFTFLSGLSGPLQNPPIWSCAPRQAAARRGGVWTAAQEPARESAPGCCRWSRTPLSASPAPWVGGAQGGLASLPGFRMEQAAGSLGISGGPRALPEMLPQARVKEGAPLLEVEADWGRKCAWRPSPPQPRGSGLPRFPEPPQLCVSAQQLLPGVSLEPSLPPPGGTPSPTPRLPRSLRCVSGVHSPPGTAQSHPAPRSP